MGDVAQILGKTLANAAASTELPPIVPTFTSGGISTFKQQQQQPQDTAGGSNGQTDGEGGQAPSTTNVSAVKLVKVGNKVISSSKRARKWSWAPFTSSSRTDNLELNHWVRANVHYVEYPFARFDIHLDPVTYTVEEYKKYLQSDTWTQSETSYLMELARIYELRWPVIHDRWYDKFYYAADGTAGDTTTTTTAAATNSSSSSISSTAASRRIEDLQHRYYEVAARLSQARISQEAANEVQQLQAATTAAAQSASAAAAAASAASAAAAAASATATSASTAAPTASSSTGPKSSSTAAASSSSTPKSGPAGSTAQKTSATATSSTSPSAPSSAGVALPPVGGGPSSVDSTLTLPPGVDEKTEGLLLETAAARAMAISPASQPLMNFVGTGSTNKMFDVTHEKKRRHHLDRMWKRSKGEEEEEMELRKELREVEAQLRKLKKSGGHILAAAGIGGTPAGGSAGLSSSNFASGGMNLPSSAASSRNPSRSVSPMPAGGTGAFFATKASTTDGNEGGTDLLDQSFASTAPVPMSGYPYLQSGRLVPPATGGDSGINKNLLGRMDEVLDQLNIKNRPLPTKRVCDMYDAVRKDILTLVTLQKMVMQKEGQLQAKQVQLAKLTRAAQPLSAAGGTTDDNNKVLLDEEGLLGIPPPEPAPAPAATKTQKTKTTKKKAPASSGGNATGGSSKKSAKKTPEDSDAATEGKGSEGAAGAKKKTVKRKRKSEAKSPPPSGGAGGGGSKSSGQTKKSSLSTSMVNASDPIALAAQAAAAAAAGVSGLDVAKAADIAVSAATKTPSTSGGGAKKRARKS